MAQHFEKPDHFCRSPERECSALAKLCTKLGTNCVPRFPLSEKIKLGDRAGFSALIGLSRAPSFLQTSADFHASARAASTLEDGHAP